VPAANRSTISPGVAAPSSTSWRTRRETAFASWVGLRGAVPIYLSIIPALADPRRDQRLFASIFILVIASLVVQGWTVGSAARVLGFARRG